MAFSCLISQQFLAISITSLAEREAERRQQSTTIVGVRAGSDHDVQTTDLVDLVVVNFGNMMCSLTPMA